MSFFPFTFMKLCMKTNALALTACRGDSTGNLSHFSSPVPEPACLSAISAISAWKSVCLHQHKVPEAQRDMMKLGIEQSKVGWSAMTDKTALAAQCKTALEQAKTSFGAMVCTF